MDSWTRAHLPRLRSGEIWDCSGGTVGRSPRNLGGLLEDIQALGDDVRRLGEDNGRLRDALAALGRSESVGPAQPRPNGLDGQDLGGGGGGGRTTGCGAGGCIVVCGSAAAEAAESPLLSSLGPLPRSGLVVFKTSQSQVVVQKDCVGRWVASALGYI